MIAADYLEIGAAGWRWVLDQVGWGDGPWIPETTTGGRCRPMPHIHL